MDALDYPVSVLDPSVRAENLMAANGLYYVRDVIRQSPEQFRMMGFSHHQIRVLNLRLKKIGAELKITTPAATPANFPRERLHRIGVDVEEFSVNQTKWMQSKDADALRWIFQKVIDADHFDLLETEIILGEPYLDFREASYTSDDGRYGFCLHLNESSDPVEVTESSEYT